MLTWCDLSVREPQDPKLIWKNLLFTHRCTSSTMCRGCKKTSFYALKQVPVSQHLGRATKPHPFPASGWVDEHLIRQLPHCWTLPVEALQNTIFVLHQYQLILFYWKIFTVHIKTLEARVFTSCCAGSRGAFGDPPCAGSPWSKCHIQTVWSPCASCCGWSSWSSGWTLCRTLGICGVFHLRNKNKNSDESIQWNLASFAWRSCSRADPGESGLSSVP